MSKDSRERCVVLHHHSKERERPRGNMATLGRRKIRLHWAEAGGLS